MGISENFNRNTLTMTEGGGILIGLDDALRSQTLLPAASNIQTGGPDTCLNMRRNPGSSLSLHVILFKALQP